MASFKRTEVKLREGGAPSLLLHHLELLLGEVGPVDGGQGLGLEDLALLVVRGVEHSQQRGLELTHTQVYCGRHKELSRKPLSILFGGDDSDFQSIQ